MKSLTEETGNGKIVVYENFKPEVSFYLRIFFG